MQTNNTLMLSGGVLLAVGLNDIYTLIAIVAIGLGVLSTIITIIVKFVNFVKDGKLTKEEQAQLVSDLKQAGDKIEYLQGYIEELKKGDK